MPDQPPKELICPICYNKLIKAGSFIICSFDRVIISFKPIKDLEVVYFTTKEIEDLEAKNKEKNKQNMLAKAREDHKKELLEQESKSS